MNQPRPRPSWRLLSLALCLMFAAFARADYNPVAITTNSYNADMVVEKAWTNRMIENYETVSIDGGTNNNGDTMFEMGYWKGQSNAVLGYTPGISPGPGFVPDIGYGMPPHGTTWSSRDGSGRTWQMAPDYHQNDAIVVWTNSPYQSCTVTLSNAAAYQTLSILNCGGGGGGPLAVIINHQGGGSETNQITVGDWFGGTSGTIADYLHARINANSGTVDNFSAANDGGAPHLFYNDVSLSDQVNPVVSVTFTTTSGNRLCVYGLSGTSNGGATWSPVGFSGYNVREIIPADAPHPASYFGFESVSLDGGTNISGNSIYEIGFNKNALGTGLPLHGTTYVTNGNAYLMPPDYTTNCVLFVGQSIPAGTLTFSNALSVSNLSVLAIGASGPNTINYTVNHQNHGAVESGNFVVTDWTSGNSGFLYNLAGQYNEVSSGFSTGGNVKLWTNNITITDPDPVVSVTFSYNAGGRSYILAISTSVDNGATYQANGIYGWNADGVIEAGAAWPFMGNPVQLGRPTNLYGTNITTASVDGGVSDTGNTFYEQGLDQTFPLTGLPPAGSTINSLADATHHFTFAPSWTANNAIFVDATNIPSASIAVKPPYATYSAFSFLGAAANGGTTNQIILQHLDGTRETNVFVVGDWFNGSPFAFNLNGRVDLHSATFNTEYGSNPRLYESQFALQNTGSPVTNFIISYLAAVNPANSNTARTVIFAVSATAGAVPPIVGSIAPASFNGLEGTNVSLSCPITGGTAPITYSWLYSANQTGPWTTLANGTNLTLGGNFSNVTTTNMLITNAVYGDSGYYEMVAQNVAGAVTSAPVLINFISSLADVFRPGDPVVAVEAAANSPAAETIDHSIDGLDQKYLDFAGAGDANPTGIICTPSMGSTIVTVVRLFSANDTPGRDPNDVMVDGSNDGGTTWVNLLPDTLTGMGGAFPRNTTTTAACNPLTQAMKEWHFANSTGYKTYRVTFNGIVDPTQNSMQIGEIQLLGVLTPGLPNFVVQPPPNITNYVGSSPSLQVAVVGFPSNFTYQWYKVPSTPLAGKTTATLQLNNVQLSDSGSQYYCAVSNSFGGTNSSTASLTVIPAPTGAYATTILGDHPIAYIRLDETPDNGSGNDGTIANDYVGDHSGYYSNVVLGVQGYNTHDSDTAMQVGQFASSASYVEGVNGINFASPSNTPTAFSVEAWANGLFGLVQQPPGAGVVAKGYGGGGEEFAIDTGGTGNLAYRFYVRDAGGTSHNVSATVTNNTVDGLWHHIVGVCDEVNSNISIYIDGALSGRTSVDPKGGILGGASSVIANFPVSIGARNAGAGGPYTNQFIGSIDEVAIYNYALSSNQVLAHYGASQVPPYFAIVPVNTTVSENGNVTFTSFAPGTAPVTYQWYVSVNGGATFSAISGATNANYTITNVSFTANGNIYEVTAHNTYATVTSSTATLTVVQTLALEQDVQSSYLAYPGGALKLSVIFDGSLPITYGWWYNGAPLANGGHYSGVNSNVLTISAIVSSNAGTYQLFATNSHGTAASGIATVTLLPSVVTFFGSGSNWTANANYGAQPISGNVLQPTDGNGGENYAAWFNSPLYIGGFIAQYTYQENQGAGGADGVAFVVQNDSRGTAAIGGGGGSLGFVGGPGAGIIPGAAVAWNIYSGNGIGGIGLEFLANGAHEGVFSSAPVDVTTDHPILMTVKYLNGILSVTASDTNASTSYTTNVSIDLPGLMGTNAAYVGFTGADGGVAAIQTVSNFSFTPIVTLTSQVVGGSLVLSWPAGSGGYVLQGSPTLNPSSWSNSGTAVVVVNGFNTVTVPISGAEHFYRLNLAPGN